MTPNIDTYRAYVKLVSQYIETIETTRKDSPVLVEAYARLRFLVSKIKELS
jgi:hypothetical protein